MNVVKNKALPDGFKAWIVASVSVLLVSLMLVLGDIVAAFVYFSDKTSPLWVTLLGVAGVLGVGLGFAGLFLLMALAGWRSYRESKRVQIISPVREGQADR
jgi:H+/Cl- antiporter ClcA